MNDRELLEYIAAQVGGLTSQVGQLTTKVDSIDTRLTKIESTLENDIKPNTKLALQGFVDTNEKLVNIEDNVKWIKDQQKIDGIKIDIAKSKVEGIESKIEKNTKILEEVKEEVARHEEVIIKRVK